MSAPAEAVRGDAAWVDQAKRELFAGVDRFVGPVAAMCAAAELTIDGAVPSEALIASQLRDMIAKLGVTRQEVFSDYHSVWAYSRRGEWGMSFTFDLVNFHLVREREVEREPATETVPHCKGCGADLQRHGVWATPRPADRGGNVEAPATCECGRIFRVLRRPALYQVFTAE